jgi:hypothetical protein
MSQKMRPFLLSLFVGSLLSSCLFESPKDTTTDISSFENHWQVFADTSSGFATEPTIDTLFLRPGDTLWLRTNSGADPAKLQSLQWKLGDTLLPVALDSLAPFVLPDSGAFMPSLLIEDQAGHQQSFSTARTIVVVPNWLPHALILKHPVAVEATGEKVRFVWADSLREPLYQKLRIEVADDSLMSQPRWSAMPASDTVYQAALSLQPGLFWWRICMSDRMDSLCSKSALFYYQGLNLENGGSVSGSTYLQGLLPGSVGDLWVSLQKSGSTVILSQEADSVGAYSFTGLAPGKYTLSLTDSLQRGYVAFNDTILDVLNLVPTHLRSFTLADTAAPRVFATGLHHGDTLWSLAEGRTLELQGGFTDQGSGIDTSSLSIVLDGKMISTNRSVSSLKWSFASSGIEDGAHHLVIVGNDRAGNAFLGDWRFVVNAKQIHLTWLQGPQLSPGGTLQLAVSPLQFSPACQLVQWSTIDGAASGFFANSADTIVIPSSATWSNKIHIRATDLAGFSRDTTVSFEFGN